ncbi:uncharacterized protein [Ptychodera flava]|uniref:uncharacterized protein isoform X4 n=1 Tax=Ptychodera flava TaxID=63121 RepID=UPI00396A2014
MGIKNLFSQTHGATRPVWLRDFAGETLAVDASVILHKGCCGCAREIAMNIPTDRYLKYFMKVVFNLEKFGVKPLIVFDGQLFPAKCAENKKREHQRSSSVKKAIALWNEKKYIDAQRLFSTSVSISEEMVQTVIKSLRAHNVNYIVAPYEADAQMAYLSKCGVVQGVITEDSDVLVYGASKVFTKIDQHLPWK